MLLATAEFRRVSGGNVNKKLKLAVHFKWWLFPQTNGVILSFLHVKLSISVKTGDILKL